MAQHQIIELAAPVGGLDRSLGYQSKPPYRFERGLNVRAFDVIESRARIGSRPGQVKTYPERLGDTTPVVSYGPQDFFATSDAFVDSDSPTVNYDQSGLALWVYANALLYKRRSFLHYNLAAIPTAATITSAVLYLSSSTSGTAGGSAALAKRLTTTAWVESQVTWNRASDALAWTTPGGDATETAEAGWTVSSSYGQYVDSISMIALVQDAVTTRSGALHMMLKIADETVQNKIKSFKDSEFATTPNRNPKLTVAWEV